MQNFRYHFGFRLLWAAMGLQMLNLSIDAPDLMPESVPEDLSYNEQESVVELILESIICLDDIIPEYDDQDSEEQSQKNEVKLDLALIAKHDIHLFEETLVHRQVQFMAPQRFASQDFQRSDTPPPQV